MSYAAANARRLGFEAAAEAGCRAIGPRGSTRRFDLILCNPPYVADGAELGPGVREYEPDEALFAGEEGLDAYRALAPQLPRLLEPGGLAAVEIGHDQADGGHRAARARRARGAGSRTTSPDAPARAAANLGLNENRLASARRAHYISGQGRARSTTKAESASRPNPRRNRPFISRI